MYKIGIPKEIKEYENRVSIVPNDVKRLLDSNDNIYNNSFCITRMGRFGAIRCHIPKP